MPTGDKVYAGRAAGDNTPFDELPHAEVIFENGESGLVCMDQGEDALVAALKEHNRRAKNGEPIHNSWGADERPIPATRIARVLIYENGTPGREVASVSADVAKKELAAHVSAVADIEDEVHGPKGVVNLYALADHVLPRVLVDKEHPHDSAYVAQEDRELDASLWGGDK